VRSRIPAGPSFAPCGELSRDAIDDPRWVFRQRSVLSEASTNDQRTLDMSAKPQIGQLTREPDDG
jgi:hypothetical protein